MHYGSDVSAYIISNNIDRCNSYFFFGSHRIFEKGTAAYKFLNSRIVYIGLISYSLYLWHWGVLSISRWTIGIHWWSTPFQVALVFGLAVSSYKWIETPLRKENWLGKRWKTIIFGGGVIITLSGIFA